MKHFTRNEIKELSAICAFVMVFIVAFFFLIVAAMKEYEAEENRLQTIERKIEEISKVLEIETD